MHERLLFLEFLRKLVHLSGLFIVVGYTLLLNYFSEQIAILVMTALLLIFLQVEYFRLEHKPKMADKFAFLLRSHEQTQMNAAVFFVMSCIIAFSAFDYWVAVLATFMTVFGDLFAALVGKAFGGFKIYKSKTFVGTFAGFAANFLVGFLILPEYIFLVLPVAFTATLVELLTAKLDDNLTVPLFSGFVGQMVVYFYQIHLPPIDFTLLGLF